MKSYLFPKDYIVFDIETTGLNARMDEIIEIGAVKVVNHYVVDTFSEFIRPQKPISRFITNLTGITNEMVENARSIEDVLSDFLLFIGDAILIGHNVSFDLGFMKYNLEYFLGIQLENQSIDNLRYARKLLPELSHHKLSDCVSYFNIIQTTAHRALDDAQATYEVFEHLRQLHEKETQSDTSKEDKNKALIYQLELCLLQPEVRRNPVLLSEYISDDFIEYCSSGVIYQYQNGDIFDGTDSDQWIMTDFNVKELNKKHQLATYTLIKADGQKSIRSSIWQKQKKGWKMIFHQGTKSY